MQSRNDQPAFYDFNFGVDSVFNNIAEWPNTHTPVLPNAFLLLDSTNFLLLDGTNFLLLGT